MNPTKEALLNGAFEVFNKMSYSCARIEDITNAANCGKGTFYKYFTNKEDCLYELGNSAFQKMMEEAEPILENSEPEQVIFNLCNHFIDSTVAGPKGCTKVFYFESLALGARFEKLLIHNKHCMSKSLYRALQINNPKMNHKTLEIQTSVIHAMLLDFSYYALVDENIANKKEFITKLTYMLNCCSCTASL